MYKLEGRRKFLPGKNYSTPTQFFQARAMVSSSLLHTTPIVQNSKSHSMCLMGVFLRGHAGLQAPAWFRTLDKLLHFCELLSVKLEQSLRSHSCLTLPPQIQPCQQLTDLYVYRIKGSGFSYQVSLLCCNQPYPLLTISVTPKPQSLTWAKFWE